MPSTSARAHSGPSSSMLRDDSSTNTASPRHSRCWLPASDICAANRDCRHPSHPATGPTASAGPTSASSVRSRRRSPSSWRAAASVQTCGELTAVVDGPRILGTHQLEQIDELLACLVVGLHLIEQRGELFVVVVLWCRAHACERRHGAGPVGLGDPAEQCQRLVGVAVTHQQLGEGHDDVLVGRFHRQCDPQAGLVARCEQLGDRLLLLGRQQRVHELLHGLFGVCPHETVDHGTVLHGVHRRDRLHLEGLAEPGVLVDVDLRQHHLAAGRIDHLLDDRSERLARAAPGRPEVDHHGHLVGRVEYVGLERFVGDVDGSHTRNATAGVGHPQDGYPRTRMSNVPGIESDAVTRWLEANVDGARGPFTFEVIAGGHSNLTYRVDGQGRERYVLRRPPLGHVLASAHDMGREHRVLSGLQDTSVPVPPVRGFCDDPSVNGAPFYVMGYVDGHVLRDRDSAVAVLDEAARSNASRSLVDTMVAIHAVDLQEAGLADLGRHEGYIERQLTRWYGQWNQGRTRDLPSVDRAYERLLDRIPEQGPATIVHGDYRLDNCMVASNGDVVAVLDWEICTLGDPLADLGLLQVYWNGRGRRAGRPACRSPSRARPPRRRCWPPCSCRGGSRRGRSWPAPARGCARAAARRRGRPTGGHACGPGSTGRTTA